MKRGEEETRVGLAYVAGNTHPPVGTLAAALTIPGKKKNEIIE
tara:strand:+ start:1136 stop:1264 length:129 start_codon:yes stop_codon:yes gene_type:complete